ncbi:MAG: glucose 1-dehydrogenase [Atribacterota bacterium]|nr:glucose 1-dehydrogenase [Atribacterota bacterium]
MRLKDKVAIVTGAGSKRGIGHATAQTLAHEGAKIIVQDLNLEGAKLVTSEILNQGGEAIAVGGNVANYSDMCEMAKVASTTFGHIDILVFCAGITQARTILDVTLEDWDRIISVNLTGTFNAIKAVIPWMVKHRYGKIVAISSVAAKGGSIFGGVHYSAAKAGILGLIKTAALNVAQYGICVNGICPGMIDTDISKGQMTDEVYKKLKEKVKENTPLKRLGTIQDIANTILFLASEESSYITGEFINVNGGHYID